MTRCRTPTKPLEREVSSPFTTAGNDPSAVTAVGFHRYHRQHHKYGSDWTVARRQDTEAAFALQDIITATPPDIAVEVAIDAGHGDRPDLSLRVNVAYQSMRKPLDKTKDYNAADFRWYPRQKANQNPNNYTIEFQASSRAIPIKTATADYRYQSTGQHRHGRFIKGLPINTQLTELLHSKDAQKEPVHHVMLIRVRLAMNTGRLQNNTAKKNEMLIDQFGDLGHN
ncbi:MAG: hypothetical protein Q9218_003937 [Villophora microphyllina]